MNETTSSSALALRFRPDLSVDRQWFGGRRCWIVKDPISLRYFKFREEEYAIIQLLDGRKGLDEITARFEQKFAPRRLPPPRLQSFLTNLHRNGLLLSDGSDQADQLLSRRQLQSRGQIVRSLSNVLAIRLPGIDPQPILDWLYPKVRWCFTPWFLAGCILFALAALLLVIAQAGELRARLPDFQAFVSTQNLVWLAVALALTKMLHEFGHALTCRHFGGECHELGVMLLVFTPCLYCNVTDSWMLRSRWQRIAISGAGIMVEIMLASLAAVLWWFSQPGLINATSLNIMVVCAVGTLLLNGNPLLRYDGYFILSDLLEAPNLWSDSRAVVRRFLARWTLGLRLQDSVSDPRRKLLGSYGIASMIYRVFVMVAIFLFLFNVLAPAGLRVVAYGIGGTVVMSLLWSSFAQTRRIIADPIVRRQLSVRRLFATSSVIAAGLVFFFLVPLPWRVASPLIVEPDGTHYVYVSEPGMLVESVSAGEQVTAGQRLARLEDPQLAREVANLASELAQLEQRVRSLESRAVEDPAASAQLPATREMVADARQRLTQRTREQESLILKAPVAGTVLSPAAVRTQDQTSDQLRRWSGSPLDPRNIGATMERGELFCLIGDPRRHKAVLFIDEADIELVGEQQLVRMSLELSRGDILTGTIDELADQEIQVVPPELAASNEIPHEVDSDGVVRPLKSYYQVRVQVDQVDRPLLISARGTARIQVAPRPLSYRAYRLIRRSFTVPLPDRPAGRAP